MFQKIKKLLVTKFLSSSEISYLSWIFQKYFIDIFSRKKEANIYNLFIKLNKKIHLLYFSIQNRNEICKKSLFITKKTQFENLDKRLIYLHLNQTNQLIKSFKKLPNSTFYCSYMQINGFFIYPLFFCFLLNIISYFTF